MNNEEIDTKKEEQADQIEKIKGEAQKIVGCESIAELKAAVNKINQLMAPKPQIEVVSAAEAVKQFQERQNEPAPDYLSWGLKDLDKRLFVQPGDFVVVGGYPSSGKTLLSLQFALEMSKTRRVGYFSFETGVDKLADRVISRIAQVELSKIKNKRLSNEEKTFVEKAREELQERSLDFIDSAGRNLHEVQAMTQSNKYDVIFVDYLQLMKITGRYQNRYEQVTAISMGLHTMARQCKCAVIALAQLSRPEKVVGKPLPPTMNSFRESGQIEQDADAAMLLYPADPEKTQSDRVLNLAKNKEGELCKMTLVFDGSKQTLISNTSRRRPAKTKGEKK